MLINSAKAESIIVSVGTCDRTFSSTLKTLDEKSRAIATRHSQYLGECDLRLHLSIYVEVLEFLSTNSEKWTLSKLVALSVNTLQGYIQPTPYRKLVAIETIPTYEITAYVLYPILGTSWAREISKLDKKTSKNKILPIQVRNNRLSN